MKLIRKCSRCGGIIWFNNRIKNKHIQCHYLDIIDTKNNSIKLLEKVIHDPAYITSEIIIQYLNSRRAKALNSTYLNMSTEAYNELSKDCHYNEIVQYSTEIINDQEYQLEWFCGLKIIVYNDITGWYVN